MQNLPESTNSSSDGILHSASMKVGAALLALAPLSMETELLAQEKPELPIASSPDYSKERAANFYCVDRSGGSNAVSNISGNLITVDNSGFFYRDSKGEEQFLPHADVIRVSFSKNPFTIVSPEKESSKEETFVTNSFAEANTTVALTDGSTVQVGDMRYDTTDREATVYDGDSNYTVPFRSIRFVRFATNNQFDEHWNELVDGKDDPVSQVVIRRETTLDYINAAVTGISETAIDIDLDGQQIKAPRGKKIEGIIFRNAPAADELPPAICMVKGSFGTLRVSETEFTESGLKISTPGGVNTTVSLTSITEIDYSPCKAEDLQSLRTITRQFDPLAGIEDPASQLDAMMSGAVKAKDTKPVTYDGKVYSDALTISPGSTLEFYTREQFDKLIGFIASSDSIETGEATITIRDGDTILLETDVSATPEAIAPGAYTPGGFMGFFGTQAKPEITPPGRSAKVPLDLDISAARRVTIEVSGDFPVTLFDARGLKKPAD